MLKTAFLIFLFPLVATASVQATGSEVSKLDLKKELKADLASRKTISFEKILSKWQKNYGTSAIPTLLDLARDQRAEDPDRYIAIMAAAKLGGKNMADAIVPLLKDDCWMVRTGAIRALRLLKSDNYGKAVLPLIKDPALVVRSEAIDAIVQLRPDGSKKGLITVLSDNSNFKAGKPHWVAQKAVAGLETLTGKTLAKKASLQTQINAWKAEQN